MPSSDTETVIHGSPFGPVTMTAAKTALGDTPAGSCLRFADTGGWADVPADVSRLTSDAATIEAWINTSAAPGAGSGQVIYIGKDGDGASPRISVDASSRIKVYWSSAGTGGGHASADTRPVTDGSWHHVAVVFDRGAITFYKDGQPTAEPGPVSMPGGQPAGSPCQIGAGLGDAAGFVGQVFDLRLWSQPRTAGQIRALMYGAVDGTLAQQLGALKQQGLVIAASFDAGRGAPVNLVSGAAGDLHDCTITQSPLPQNKPTITFGPSACDVHGVWNAMTPATSARMQAILSDPAQWPKLIEGQMQAQGLFSYLQTAGDDAFGDGTDVKTGLPVKLAEWTDGRGVTHFVEVRTGFTYQKTGGLQAEPLPVPVGGATAQTVYDSEGTAVTVIQKIENIADWTGTAAGLAAVLSGALAKGLTRYLNALKAELEQIDGFFIGTRLAGDEVDQAVNAVARVGSAVKVAEIIGKASGILAVLAALLDGIFRLFHPTTMSVSMWNRTDSDLEWSLGYMNSGGAYWLNSDGNPNGTWRPFPKKNAPDNTVNPIFGPVTVPTVAAVNLVFANGQQNAVLAADDIEACVLIREKGSTGDPYVLLLYAPLAFSNAMSMGTGKGDKDYFFSNVDSAPNELGLSYTFGIGGTPTEFHLVTDALKGQTTYAGIQGYNYNTLLYIQPKSPSPTAT